MTLTLPPSSTPRDVDPVDGSTSEAADAAKAQVVLVWLDPNDLVPDPTNVRSKIEDLRGLAASIKELGVLQPIVVRPIGDDRWQIVAGHRRQQAAILAGRTPVPCVSRLDLADAPAHVILAALGENLRRQDLTELEEARGYQQALDLGLSATRIARFTGSKPRRVRQALTVTASETATAAMVDVALTLEQAAVIAEFEDDPEAVAYLIGQAKHGEGTFKHAVSTKRRAREDEAKRQAAADTLTAAGVTVIEPPHLAPATWPHACPLDRLTQPGDAERTPLDVDTHASCPGHAAVIDRWDPDEVHYYCTDPEGHGHEHRWPSGRSGQSKSEPTEEERETAKAERREVRENNRAWRDAEPVRREYIRELLARKRPPTGCLEFVTYEILTRPDRVGDGSDAMLAELLGVDASGRWGRHVGAGLVERATKVRLPLVLLAQVAADRETSMDVHTWRQYHPHDEARWLQFLASTGYTLSTIEQTVVDHITADSAQDDDGEDSEAATGQADDDHEQGDDRPVFTVLDGENDHQDHDEEDSTASGEDDASASDDTA